MVSFVYLGIYWNNHHHMLHTLERATGGILWANMHLLFWLSLVPFVTGWMGENHFAPLPTAPYGAVLLLAAVAYFILQQTIIAAQGEGSKLKQFIGRDIKGKLSPVLYAIAIPLAFVNRWLSYAHLRRCRPDVARPRPPHRSALRRRRRLAAPAPGQRRTTTWRAPAGRPGRSCPRPTGRGCWRSGSRSASRARSC